MVENVTFRYIRPQDCKVGKTYRHFFLLNFSENVIKTVATALGITKYNHKLGYNVEYSIKDEKFFSKFRDFDTHRIIDYILNIEFNVNDLISKNIIEAAFPMHDFWTRNNIKLSFHQERKSLIFDPLKSQIVSKDLKPYNSVAFYFGCDLSLYVSFVVNMTSYLLILSIVGIVVFLLSLNVNKNMEKLLNIIYVIFVMIWLVMLNVKWNQKESVHSYQWNTEEF